MLRQNKGSILIATLIIFTIISTICMMCIDLIYSNDNIYNLDYESAKLRELSLSGIEVAYANTLSEVKKAIDTTNSKEEFENYFLGNNTQDFINNLKDISSFGLINVSIKFKGGNIYKENENIRFEIISTSKHGTYKNEISANFKIENPWNEQADIQFYNGDSDGSLNVNEIITIENEENIIKQDNNNVIHEQNDNEEIKNNIENDNIKDDFYKKDLVTVFDYKEI